MEMCYDGALVMPSSYAVMTEDEMTYVDGGLSWQAAKNAIYAAAIAVVGGVASAILKRGISNSMIGAAIKACGAWVTNLIDTTIIAVYCYPGKAAAIAFGIVALGCAGYAIYKGGKKAGVW